MSRVGSKPIAIPSGVEVQLQGNLVQVQGPRGHLERRLHPDMQVALEGSLLTVSRPTDRGFHRALHGLTRTLLANMVQGVSQGYERSLELSGVGYRAAKSGDKLVLNVGYSHPVEITPPPGVALEVLSPTRVDVRGVDKEMVGEIAARIRRVRLADPYKGKGIKYLGEQVRRKAGKAGKTAARK